MKRIAFIKYTSHGNNFVIVDETGHSVMTEAEKSKFAYKATSVDYGVGSDSFLVIQRCEPRIVKEINEFHAYWNRLPDSGDADYIFRMFQPDGKEAFSCGNGLISAAGYLYQKYGIESARMMTEIPAPVPRTALVGTDPKNRRNWANMGHSRPIPPELASGSIRKRHKKGLDMIKNIRVGLPNNRLSLFIRTLLKFSGYLVFTGEPHCVVFTETDFSCRKLANSVFTSSFCKKDYASRLIRHIGIFMNKDYSNYFPKGLNINFARVYQNSGIIEYRSFKRGINREIRASGTGAVAVSSVAAELGMATTNDIILWPYSNRFHHPNDQVYVKVKGKDYILYGESVPLFEGEFFL